MEWMDGWMGCSGVFCLCHNFFFKKKSGVHMEMLGKLLDEMMMIHGLDG